MYTNEKKNNILQQQWQKDKPVIKLHKLAWPKKKFILIIKIVLNKNIYIFFNEIKLMKLKMKHLK